MRKLNERRSYPWRCAPCLALKKDQRPDRCEACKERTAAESKKRYDKAKEERRCGSCGKQHDGGTVYCKECREQDREIGKNRNAEGLCFNCTRPVVEGHKFCETCREIGKRTAKESADRAKAEVLDRYGGPVCACPGCGETIVEMLTIDHINENGAEHRREIGKNCLGHHFYRWLRNNDYPEGYQVLCFNCNVAKHRLGYCPHCPEFDMFKGTIKIYTDSDNEVNDDDDDEALVDSMHCAAVSRPGKCPRDCDDDGAGVQGASGND